ncbi:double-strand break repair helicase AddA [Anianabacter salinae]|uniref:double-strand break repair helicase AddA n=1 Tax=Anianabacter salinae TaxID=2851023 RepID=UPI00225DE5F5|nr:double-strand break repair helicase AddA [Anianabacter salinae]MBV0913497.1 double-strand break repair helicase AddA [Anianabacter salinae]
MTLNDATRRQVQAANPDASTWLSANAGSGKTRVLTDRVARLLLSGVEPQNVLCLTYTKAAASEMQNRLFRQLGAWALMPDNELAEALFALEQGLKPGADQLARARRLFARAIETPGGLRIQTIHSFCAGLLRRFPLEAGVTPNFTEMDDRTAALLRDEVLEQIAEGPDRAALDGLIRHHTGDDLSRLTATVVAKRDRLLGDVDADEVKAWFGLRPDRTMDRALNRVFLGAEADLIARLLPHLRASGPNDQKAAVKLEAVPFHNPEAAFHRLADVLLTGAGTKAPFSAKIGSFPTKACSEGLGDIADPLESLMLRVEAERATILALHNADRTAALYRFAAVFLPAYAARKQARGWLDFDDLILKTRDLLDNPQVAAWVLYRLDGGIDHILVDEAQDTSPEQWQVIERLAQEFTAGQGARDTRRTIFVVGDPKQSIYSFQGADPRKFSRMRDAFATRLQSVGEGLQSLTLEYSFRSSEAVLRSVDRTLTGRDEIFEDNHRAFHDALPGRVELWPVVPKSEPGEDIAWYDPVDRVSQTDPNVVLAERIAARIARMLDDGETIPAGSGTRRPVRAGDVMILVQRRSALFSEIIRACKAKNLPIAGADRLKLGAELAVRDIAAVLAFLSTPEDDLSLATILRSPLFGWSEDQLFRLATTRGDLYLWRHLYDAADRFPETVSILTDLRAQADYLRPYDLIERLLTRHDGRRRLLARLGPEAEDGIDALLSQALAYERMEVPSLTGFLSWFETEDVEVKRQLDSAGDRIRVMTVHGAKGLESPIVILPDTMSARNDIKDELVTLENGRPAWKPVADFVTPEIAEAMDRIRASQAEERLRLLYVAMTRAEKWLIVCGAGDLPKSGECWYQQVQAGLDAVGAVPVVTPDGIGQSYATGDWTGLPLTKAPVSAETETVLMPVWATQRLAPAVDTHTLSPSDLGGAKALPGDSEGADLEAALLRGSRIHLLLEHLPLVPQDARRGTALALLTAADPPMTEAEALDLLSHAERVIAAPGLEAVFAPGALAEVGITANLASLGGQRIHGAIDRLIVTGDSVLAVDFKTNAIVPDRPEDVPLGLLRQMGAYAEALEQLYPAHRVETAILWTQTASLMTLPRETVVSALAHATLS